jgi:CxxC motif-containing protein
MNSLTDSDKPMEIICVACPHGCRLEATRRDGEIMISNAGCKRGKEYAINEITDPRRMVATTVRVKHGIHPLLPVYTTEPFPKGRIKELLQEIRKVEINAPVKMNQVVLENALGTGINVVASRDLA